MAQMGSFVPARQAKLPIIDRIFTRIGASDNLARGRSTFLVEMSEVAAILNHATPASLVLLDEVGRGTANLLTASPSCAQAVVEHLQKHTRARTLFATHYHELTELADLLPAVKNVHVSVKETPNEIIFLRHVEPGSASKSYGIEVARLAGLPRSVIERAREVLKKHEQSEHELSERLTPGASSGDPLKSLTRNPLHPYRPPSPRPPAQHRSRPTHPHRRPNPPGRPKKTNLLAASVFSGTASLPLCAVTKDPPRCPRRFSRLRARFPCGRAGVLADTLCLSGRHRAVPLEWLHATRRGALLPHSNPSTPRSSCRAFHVKLHRSASEESDGLAIESMIAKASIACNRQPATFPHER